MRAYRLEKFGLENLRFVDAQPPGAPGPGEVVLDVKAVSLNYRDLMVIRGEYNPRLKLPAIPLSDGAGVVTAVGAGVDRVRPGNEVMSHFVSGWLNGPFLTRYRETTLGTPGPGLAADQVTLPAEAVVLMPARYTFEQAATLPIAALTAWSALVTEGGLDPTRAQQQVTVLTLGTGGVAIFALQFAKALGARVIITSSSDEKLSRAKELGADHAINYRKNPHWEKEVLAATDGEGVDITVETGGAGTLDKSLSATRGGGVVALLGALTGVKSEVTTGMILMKRLRVAGILVDSRRSFNDMVRFIEQSRIEPVIDTCFEFDQLPEALAHMQGGRHFGKIALEL